MAEPLLVTKFHSPRSSPQSIPRPRLKRKIEQLFQAGHSFLLVSAPAGFGKTGLLGEWTAQDQGHTAWLTLDEEDNDAARFWVYFLAALRNVQDDLGENGRALLQSQPPPVIETFLTVLLNELAAAARPFTLILDDYHLIDTPAIHNGLAFLIDHLPAQMRLVISSRADPPLPLSRWRAGGLLGEIRLADLRFTKDETSAFFAGILEASLSPDELLALIERTEGWITGLQLAALSMQGRKDLRSFIADFTGSNHYIVDYLTEEILQRQPEAVQSFLLHTAILDRLCSPLCEVVTGRPAGQDMLERLERANLFLQPLDDERHWYRYHQLFLDMLRGRLRRLEPDLISELHRRASQWCEQNGLPGDAIRHALAAEDYPRAADLIMASAEDVFWQRGEISTMLAWLNNLPDEVVRRCPRLCLTHAWALLLSGRLTEVDGRLADFEAALAQEQASGSEPAAARGLRGQAAAIHARLARLQNDLPRSIELCRSALEYLPQDDTYLRGVITLNLGLACWQSGEIASALRVLEEAAAIAVPGGDVGTSLAAREFLGDLQAEMGRLRQAAVTYHQAIEQAAGSEERPIPIASWAYAGLGELHLQWNDLQAAEQSFANCLELARLWGNADGLVWAYRCMAKLEYARGNMEAAGGALSQAEQIARSWRVSPWTASGLAGFRGKFLASQGKTAEAMRWGEGQGLAAAHEVSYQRLPEYLSFARLLLLQKKWEDLESLLMRLQALVESQNLQGRAIEILVLQALSYQGQKKASLAQAALEQALALAEPEGYRRIFLDEGEKMGLMILDFRLRIEKTESGVDSGNLRNILDYVSALISDFDATQSAEANEPSITNPQSIIDSQQSEINNQQSKIINQQSKINNSQSIISNQKSKITNLLSPRELEILALLAQGLTNQEIAGRLYISTGTVKVHLKHIFSKLDAGNRTEAAARARQLSLL